mmetsp:Transcript_13252/g.32343  ORF Transcript_13252/g.32343 Transcript_13252/m.32343 type:complete len:439 (-) Transcript_13252:87-1403(-)
MSDETTLWWIPIVSTVVILTFIGITYRKFGQQSEEDREGRHHPQHPLHRRNPWYCHVILFGSMAIVAVCVPPSVARYVFSDLLVTAVATVFPIWESVRAVCTPDENDDKLWLQYWLVGGILFMCTGWVDDVMLNAASASQDGYGDDDTVNDNNNGSGTSSGNSDAVVYWYEAMFTMFLWLYFPFTNGATLIYENITKPLLTPIATSASRQMNNYIVAIYHGMVNAAHLWVLWFVFMFLPSGLKRVVAIGIGTIYPFTASVAAAATPEVDDDTYWLTYWSCYGCLFLIMDILEVWLGWIPGFYTLVIFATVYLMLPMFEGADKIFRKILVPLAGLQELLMLRDAIQIKKSMLKDLDPERQRVVRKAIAKFFADNNDDGDDGDFDRRSGGGESGSGSSSTWGDPMRLQRELMSGWHTVSFRGSRTTEPSTSRTDLSTPIV